LSLEALTYVFDLSDVTGIDRLVMIALADSASDYGIVLDPDPASIARIARLNPDDVSEILLDLMASDYLRRPTGIPAGFPCAVQIVAWKAGTGHE
jgi:hypothetical protein